MLRATVVVLLLAVTASSAQTPKLEVGSIKRNTTGAGSGGASLAKERLVAVNVRPLLLVRMAYPYEPYRIIGAPGWASTENYDVTAIANVPVTREQLPGLLRAFLAEHFGLAVHTEMRPQQVYALVLARSDGRLGPRMKPWTVDCDALRAAGTIPPLPPRTTAADFATPHPCRRTGGRGAYAAGGGTIAELINTLEQQLAASVVDRTGLSGEFEMSLQWNPDPSLPGADPSLPSLFAAVQEQLGLRLESGREPVEVLVIDRFERPKTD